MTNQEIFEIIAERTGENVETVKRVLYNTANYIRAALQDPERPSVLWNGLLKFEMIEKRIKKYLERIEERKEDPRSDDEKNRRYYTELLELIKKHEHGSRKKD